MTNETFHEAATALVNDLHLPFADLVVLRNNVESEMRRLVAQAYEEAAVIVERSPIVQSDSAPLQAAERTQAMIASWIRSLKDCLVAETVSS